MHFNKIFVTIAMFAAGSAFAQNAEIGTWAGFRKGAASFTFDDGAPSHVSDAAPVFDKYGYKGTFNLVVNWNPNWSGFQSMANNGHEIASHSNSHGQNMSGEEGSSKQNIQGRINQKYGIITVAYPNCNVPNEGAVLQNYVVGRICNGSWQGQSDIMGKNGPSNWAKASAIMTGSEGSIKSTNDFTGNMQKAVQQGGWVAFLTHGFSGKNNGNANYSPTDLGAIDGALQWAKQNDKDIWVAPMGHVAMYIKERDATKVESSNSDGNSITFELKHNIANNVSKFDYPLSVRVKSSWSSFDVTQNGTKLNAKADGGYIYFDAVPNGGKIVVSSGGGGGATTGNTGNTGNNNGFGQTQQGQGGFDWNQGQGQGGFGQGGFGQGGFGQGGFGQGGFGQGGFDWNQGQQQQQQQQTWNQPQQQQSNCWSQQLGYPCCNQGTVVAYTDSYGKWGVQNNNWCGIPNSNNKNCWASALGYNCCSTVLCRIPQYSDTDGQWDVDGNQWCGISTNNIIC